MFRYLISNPSLQKELRLDPFKALKIHYEIPSRNLMHKLIFGITKRYSNLKISKGHKWKFWNRINEDLILGTIPELTQCESIISFAKNSVQSIKPLGMVVSVVDYFELGKNSLLSKLATPIEWKIRGIKQCSLPMRDFSANIPVGSIINIIDKIRDQNLLGFSVYIHCKAGRGRSAMLCAIYFAVFDSEYKREIPSIALEKAIEKIKSCRIQINLNDAQKAKAIEAIKAIREIQKTQKQHNALELNKIKNPPVSPDELFSLIQTKADIAQMTTFKELAIYAATQEETTILAKVHCTNHIRFLFKLIYNATNADWYRNYTKNLQQFVNAETKWNSVNDKETRKKLADSFQDELQSYITRKQNT